MAPLVAVVALGAAACEDDDRPARVAEGIYAPLGEPLPAASDEQLGAFERGREIALRRFSPEQGLGPTVNVSFCVSCHESPVIGGSAPRYRDFFLTGQEFDDGAFLPLGKGGVLTTYGFHGADVRTPFDDATNVVARRNAIPFFGTGLIAELPDEAILKHADPDDEDGDGISGRPNYDQGFVGRFGRKSQTVSVEGFIRGPLFNHLGITTDPLTEAQKAALPVPSASVEDGDGPTLRQAAAPAEPLTDEDGVADPELSTDDLFDLVSFAMLMAAPEPGPVTEQSELGRERFEDIGCADCHVPALKGPRGLVPLYSDLLLHDMGEAMADGFVQGEASGSEFRTQPLWGVAATRPYLHDGRADTLEEAILAHGGEGSRARDAYVALGRTGKREIQAFLESLGGVSQASDGLLAPDAPVPAPGEPGAPVAGTDMARFLSGRAAFDRDARISEGLGPEFNGDSCRACHFDPVIGGAGPIDLNVVRHGTTDTDGNFTAPAGGTILHRLAVPGEVRPEPSGDENTFETRQTPTLLGLGQIDQIPEDVILAGADPEDLDGDGVRGVAHVLPDGRVGRLGWKAQVPSIREFVRDAASAEMGLTVPDEPGLTFGVLADDDDASDPEMPPATVDELEFFMTQLAPPQPTADVPGGIAAFEAAACDACHTPTLDGAAGPVPLYSDLLLHDVSPQGAWGITDGMAAPTQFRTPPLWGLSTTAPYLHDGRAATVEAAIQAHDGEAAASVALFEGLDAGTRETLLAFLASL